MDDNNNYQQNNQQPPNYQQPPPQYQQQPNYQQPPPGFQQQPYGYPEYNRPVGFIEAYVAYWKNYVNFNDRTSRAGYWWVVLMNVIIGTIIGTISSAAAFATPAPLFYGDMSVIAALAGVSVISNIWSLINLIPGLAICVRRLHDVGKRWTWMLIGLIPIVGWIIFIVIVAAPQKHPAENEFAYLRQV